MLKVEKIHCRYDQVEVLQGISLQLERGEILGLLGRNGAGKTTLLKALMGLVPLDSGKIFIDEQELSDLETHEIPKQGVSLVPQGRRIFPFLSVEENLRLGILVRNSAPNVLEWVLELFPVLRERLNQKAGTLSGGEQQILATARALCLEPKYLLLDEPSEGLMPKLIELVFMTLEKLKTEKVGILLVEQKIDGVLRIANRISFLEYGNIRLETTPSELQNDSAPLYHFVGVKTQKTEISKPSIATK